MFSGLKNLEKAWNFVLLELYEPCQPYLEPAFSFPLSP